MIGAIIAGLVIGVLYCAIAWVLIGMFFRWFSFESKPNTGNFYTKSVAEGKKKTPLPLPLNYESHLFYNKFEDAENMYRSEVGARIITPPTDLKIGYNGAKGNV